MRHLDRDAHIRIMAGLTIRLHPHLHRADVIDALLRLAPDERRRVYRELLRAQRGVVTC